MLGTSEAAPNGLSAGGSIGFSTVNLKRKSSNGSQRARKNKENRDTPGMSDDSMTSTEGQGESSENESNQGTEYVPLSQPGRPPRREYLEQTKECRWQGCGKTFRTPDEARNHEQVHGLNESEYMVGDRARCMIRGCNKIFTDAKVFKKHLQLHRPPQLECSMCGKRFHEAAKLRRHESVHTGEKPFACETCGKEFAFKANLKTHQRVHTGERPFPCTFPGCQRTFAQASNRNAHMQVHTRGKAGEAGGSASPPLEHQETAERTGRVTPRAAPAEAAGPTGKRQRVVAAPEEEEQAASQHATAASSAMLGTIPSLMNGPLSAGIRSSSPYIYGYAQPSFAISASGALAQVSSAFTPIQRPGLRQTSGLTVGSSQESQGPSSNERDNSLLYQFAQLSSEAVDLRGTAGSPLLALSPIGFSTVPMFQGATPLCLVAPSGRGSAGGGAAGANTSSSSSGFSDGSLLYSSSLNHSLASHGSGSSQGWMPQGLDERSLLTPHVARFTPDALK